ncbi:hypothetical protein JLDANKMP_03366 [Stenotrophomonas sp. PE591]|nr:hypothetical protein [Stenotrophomonas sp. PE591]
MLATTLSPLSWAPCSVVSLPLITVRLRSASTTVSTCVVPLPLPLPLAVLADTYQPVCAPMLKPISPLPLLFFDDCVWSSASLRRVMLSRAASATLSPFTWLPMMLRSPAVATMLTSPWLRMVLPTADWSWLVWLALELEAPMPMPLAVLADTYQPVCAPMLKPISPLPLLFFDDCVWSSASLRRVMLSRAASATLSPFTWLPMMLRSPAVATMLTSPWLRMVLPTADWSWLVWLALELEAPMPMRRLTPSVAPEAPCCMAPPTPAAALAACTAYSAFRRSSCALPAALAAP